MHDGDTFTLLTKDHEQKKIRLRHVDAPETNQPFASRSKQVLSLLVYDKTVGAVCQYRSYNRYVCDVTVAGRDVQAEHWSRPAWSGSLKSTTNVRNCGRT